MKKMNVSHSLIKATLPKEDVVVRAMIQLNLI